MLNPFYDHLNRVLDSKTQELLNVRKRKENQRNR